MIMKNKLQQKHLKPENSQRGKNKQTNKQTYLGFWKLGVRYTLVL